MVTAQYPVEKTVHIVISIDDLYKELYYYIAIFDREVSQKVIQFATQYPVITITGPGQSCKTTLYKILK